MKPAVNQASPAPRFDDILGYSVTAESIEACVAQIERWIAEPAGARYFACANPHALQVAEGDDEFKQALRSADLLTPDGAGIVLASRLLKGTIQGRVTGSDIFEKLSEALDKRGGARYFFLGSTEDTLAKIRARMAEVYPNIEVAGTYSPPFKPEFTEVDDAPMIAAINGSDADVLWVGMTAPKQEKWIFRNRSQLDVPFIGAVGAVFDFFVGNVQRSHPVFQRLGLEWLPRLLQQPARLWRRMFVSAPRFVARVIRARLARSHTRSQLSV